MMASPSEQCIRALGEKLKNIEETKVEIDLGRIVRKITNYNAKNWNMNANTISKEINFLNGLGRSLGGISITRDGVYNAKTHELTYPKISFENKEAVKAFLNKMITCKAILSSIFCYVGSGRIYKQIRKDIFGR